MSSGNATASPSRFRWRADPPPEARRLRLLALRGKNLPDAAYIDSCRSLLMRGDPVADDLAAWFEREGWANARRQLDTALSEGIAAVPDPSPELQAMMAQIERRPAWLDERLLHIGARALRRVGPLGSLALRDVALMGGYGNAAINKPLMFTGSLHQGAARRTVETRSFWVDVTREGALERGEKGFRSAIHVRMMHGVLRHRIHRHPEWSDDAWGVPINQGDMLATNLAFSLVFMTVMRAMGFQFSREERQAILHFWRYVGYLMGIDEDILVTSEAEGFRYLYSVLMSQPEPDQDTRALALSLMNEPYEQLGDGAGRRARLWAEVHLRAHNGMSHLFLGDAAYRNLGLPRGRRWDWFPLALIPLVLGSEVCRLVLPGGTRRFAGWGGKWQVSWLARRLRNRPAEFRPVERLAGSMRASEH